MSLILTSRYDISQQYSYVRNGVSMRVELLKASNILNDACFSFPEINYEINLPSRNYLGIWWYFQHH